MTSSDRSKTLEQLDGAVWPEPTYDSYLTSTCHQLRKKPLDQFGIEDLRIMIGQNIGLEHLVPIAVEVLQRDPLASGHFYPGDLLKAVLTARDSYWNDRNELRKIVIQIASKALEILKREGDEETASLREAILRFERNSIDLKSRGIDRDQAADLRARLRPMSDDWNRPEMDTYDEQ
jgi:hypothetical protein